MNRFKNITSFFERLFSEDKRDKNKRHNDEKKSKKTTGKKQKTLDKKENHKSRILKNLRKDINKLKEHETMYTTQLTNINNTIKHLSGDVTKLTWNLYRQLEI
jgi:hypothetical protein